MFPIFDLAGNPVGFAGRVFNEVAGKTVGEEAGKYINTPNTLIYDKSGVLYGLDRAKTAIKKQERAVLVEGNLDLILAHQAGTANVVATSGTALGERHLRLLRRYTDSLVFAFDADEAGERVTHKGAALAGSAGFEVSVVRFPAGRKDAADIVAADKSAWLAAVEDRRPYVRFALERALERHSPRNLEGKKKISREVLSAILTLASPLEREHWIGELATAVKTSEATLGEELARLKKVSSFPALANEEQARTTEPGIEIEDYLLALLVIYPEGVDEVADLIETIQSEKVRDALAQAAGRKNEFAEILKSNPQLLPILARAAFLDELIADKKEEFSVVVGNLKRRSVKEKLESLAAELKKAEASEDGARVKTLLSNFNSLSRELLNYEAEEKNYR